ncbi:endo-beta-N-acetylglucosaminidase [Endozoicomonas lisbonensis]|uniref:endo-beta-N-acetylglucosaminidase n=1 Tax=Endozoicomonas lisbonensis TaxID=3120522 RepID=UPI003391A03A
MGKINHQGVLNTLNHLFFWAINPSPGTGRMMIDYRWNEHSLLCDHHESYQWEDSYLFYGIDAHWEKYITPRFKSLASRHRNLALFASNWHFNNDALPSQNYETAQNYWRGTDGGDWPGVCSLVDSKPMIHSMPFSTDFNRGQGGSFYYHRGQPLEVLTASGYGWTQPQQQTPLPDTCGQKNRNARLDVKSVDITGFQGSGAIRLTPASSSESRIDLFSASYRLQGDEEIFLTYKHSNDGVYPIIELQLSYGLSKELYLPTCDKNWCTASLGLGELLGQMLQSVAVKIPAGFAPSVLDIGQLKLFKEATLMAEPPGVWISEQQTYNNRQQIRVSWKENSNADHYLLFTLDHNAQPEKFIGQTHHTSWVIDIPENISINRIGVLPVSIEGSQGIMGIIDI